MRVFGEPDFAELADDEDAVRCVELGAPAFWDRFVRAGRVGSVAYAVDGNVQPPTCRHLTVEEWAAIAAAFQTVPPVLLEDQRSGDFFDAPTVIVEVTRGGAVETWSGTATRREHPMMRACRLLWSIASPTYQAPGYL